MGPGLPVGTVTFLFTDIEGSTRLLQELGDGYNAVQDDHAEILRRAIASGAGVEIRTEGDAFFAVFASANSAVTTVVLAQRGLTDHRWTSGKPLRVRMGLHTGEGVLGGDDYLGIDVNTASRITAAANGGQVLLSGATRSLVEHDLPGGVRLRDLGKHRLKDLAYPQQLSDLEIDGVPSDFPPPRSLEVPTNLPAEVTSFVGRKRELGDVAELLERARLVTLTGPGGAGKTRLALRVAVEVRDRYPDGIFLVELAPIEDPSLVPSTIADVFGVREEWMSPRPLVESLRSNLADRHVLLILDNFEHLIDAAPMIPELMAGAPQLSVLVTSRAVLRVRGEHDVPILPLGTTRGNGDRERPGGSDAVALFAERASSVDPSFEITPANAGAVDELCDRLDGLPLAIELAASRISVLTPEMMLERLERNEPTLPEGPRDLPERQRTLPNAIAWSYELLDDPHRRLFRELSCFSGGWTAAKAEVVCSSDDLDVLGGIATLVDNSLARRRHSGAGIRFDMLRTIQEFAQERLRATPAEANAVRQRHATHFLDVVEEAEPHLRKLDLSLLDRLEMEHDNVRAALRWTIEEDEGASGLRMLSALWRFWQLRGYLGEGRRWAENIVALPSASARTRERALGVAAGGSIAYWQFDTVATRSAYEEALSIWGELGDRRGMARANYDLAYAFALEANIDGGSDCVERSLALFEEVGDRQGIGECFWTISLFSRLRGDTAISREYAQRSLEIHREIGDRFGQMDALHMLGRSAFDTGDLDEAQACFMETMTVYGEMGNRTGVAIALDNLAAQAIVRGDALRAVRLHGASEAFKELAGGMAPPVLVDLPDPREAAKASLRDEQIRAAEEEGRAMSFDQAIAYARDVSGST
jgi:predicted ATPase/class 3 adenylate cyclase